VAKDGAMQQRTGALSLLEAATPGPWTFGWYARGYDLYSTGVYDGKWLAGAFRERADAEFCAEARTLVPMLLDIIRWLHPDDEPDPRSLQTMCRDLGEEAAALLREVVSQRAEHGSAEHDQPTTDAQRVVRPAQSQDQP
jgi:hypothetical protein